MRISVLIAVALKKEDAFRYPYYVQFYRCGTELTLANEGGEGLSEMAQLYL